MYDPWVKGLVKLHEEPPMSALPLGVLDDKGGPGPLPGLLRGPGMCRLAPCCIP